VAHSHDESLDQVDRTPKNRREWKDFATPPSANPLILLK
jgi:hypothetical protein